MPSTLLSKYWLHTNCPWGFWLFHKVSLGPLGTLHTLLAAIKRNDALHIEWEMLKNWLGLEGEILAQAWKIEQFWKSIVTNILSKLSNRECIWIGDPHTEIKIPSAYRKQQKKSHKTAHYKVFSSICSSIAETFPKF